MHLVLALASCGVLVLSMAQLYLLVQEEQNEEQHYVFSPMMPLGPKLAAHDANDIKKWYHCTYEVKKIKMRCHRTFAYLRDRPLSPLNATQHFLTITSMGMGGRCHTRLVGHP